VPTLFCDRAGGAAVRTASAEATASQLLRHSRPSASAAYEALRQQTGSTEEVLSLRFLGVFAGRRVTVMTKLPAYMNNVM